MSVIAGLGVAPLQAGVILYEGFDYNIANNTSIHGTQATGSGIQGNWTVTNTGPGSPSSTYQTAGLSFGPNFATSSGGSLRLGATYGSGTNVVTTATVSLSATATGTVWGSYLANYTTIGLANGGSMLAGVATTAEGTTSNLKAGVASNTLATDRKLAAGYDNSSTVSGNFAFATGTTYLFISRFTNVGATLGGGTNGVATTWALTLAQYENWLSTGATEAGLDNNYSVRVNDTSTSGTSAFDPTGHLMFRADAPDNNGSSMIAVVDEIRFGTALADVHVVPEPSAVLLGSGAGMIPFLRRRRMA
ncbi:hypothetical protein OVA24_09910 [Luteolibacter sp. SL250]|uniref:hypothetical protein n=1 Tax=Luteolibacter sp. SL250 TaxID=2995170 RepID=UPI00226FBA95|nr:hypothetical protein [Luteolibacter sp. SL250]WAC21700.1 hypothetical protein OVA24_09910 [Luteolibacter sp. SL250]